MRPILHVALAFALALALAQVLFVLGAGVAFVATGGERAGELFGEVRLVHFTPRTPDGGDAEGLRADLKAELPELGPEVLPAEDGIDVRILVAAEREERVGRVFELARARGFEPGGRIVLMPRLFEIAGDPLGELGPAELGWMLLPAPFGLLAVGAWARRRYGGDAARRPSLTTAQELLLGAAVGGAGFALAFGLDLSLRAVGAPPAEQAIVLALLREGGAARAALFGVALVAAPLGEELFFRGFAFRHLSAERGPLVAHAVTAALFAALHFNPSGVPIYLALAVLFAESLRRTGSLAVPVVGHAVFNAAALAMHLAAA